MELSGVVASSFLKTEYCYEFLIPKNFLLFVFSASLRSELKLTLYWQNSEFHSLANKQLVSRYIS